MLKPKTPLRQLWFLRAKLLPECPDIKDIFDHDGFACYRMKRLGPLTWLLFLLVVLDDWVVVRHPTQPLRVHMSLPDLVPLPSQAGVKIETVVLFTEGKVSYLAR